MTRVVGGWRNSTRAHHGRPLSLTSGFSSSISTTGGGETLLLVLLPVLASCAALVVSARTGSTTAPSMPTSVAVPPAKSTVASLPVVPADATLVYMSRGTADRLRCPAEADPPTTLIVWSKDGTVVEATVEGIGMPDGVDDDGNSDESSTRLTISPQDNHLVISNVTSSDAGLYTCTAYSPLSSRRPTHQIMVIVKDLPYFVVRPNFIYHIARGQSVTMPCVAEGDPPPKITWKKVIGEFPPSTRTLQDIGNLTIVQLGREDQGVYECIATNVVTRIVTATLLIIQFHHSPYNISVQMTPNTAKVSWLPAYREGYRYHYLLWFRRTGDRDWQSIVVVPNDTLSMHVYQLDADTSYDFVVMARDSHGDAHYSPIVKETTRGFYDTENDDDVGFSGEYSPPTSVRLNRSTVPTPAVAPVYLRRPHPPLNVTASYRHGDGAVISWQPPPHDPTAPSPRRYVVEYRTVGPWVQLTNRLSANTFQWKLASRDATYHFRVLSDAGNDENSEATPTTLSLSFPSSVATLDTSHEDATNGDEVGMSAGAVVGLVVALSLIAAGVAAGTMFVRWYTANKKRRQRQAAAGSPVSRAAESATVRHKRFEHGRSSSLSIHRTLSGQESPLRSQPTAIQENHVTPTTNHDGLRHIQETPI